MSIFRMNTVIPNVIPYSEMLLYIPQILSSFQVNSETPQKIYCLICRSLIEEEPMNHMKNHVRLSYGLYTYKGIQPDMELDQSQSTNKRMECKHDNDDDLYFNMIPPEILQKILFSLEVSDIENMKTVLGEKAILATGIKDYKLKCLEREIEAIIKENSVKYKSLEKFPHFAKIDCVHNDTYDVIIPITTYQPFFITNEEKKREFQSEKYKLLSNMERIFNLKVLRNRLRNL